MIKKIEMNFACPACGYLVSSIEKKYTNSDYTCPICKKHKRSEFLPSTILTEMETCNKNEFN